MKNKILKTNLFFMLLGMISTTCFAQDNFFKISGQYRARTELRNGYKTLFTDSSEVAFFTAQRARLMFDFKKDNIQFYTSIQDARTWGDEEQKKDLAGLQVNELWSAIKLHPLWWVKIGRQELVYDEHRLLGNLDWANSTISHDAMVIKYKNDSLKLQWHIGAAYNQYGEPLSGTTYTLKNYKFLGFTWLKKEFNYGHALSALIIANGMNSTITTSPKMKTMYTFGPLYTYNHQNWKGILGAYLQDGRTDKNLIQKAFMVNASLEKKIDQVLLGLGVDYLSGNKDNTSVTESDNFYTLYATNHKYYGNMDYFVSFPNDTKQRGLTDIFARIGYIPSKLWSTALDIHNFSLANAYLSGSTSEIKKPLGTEVDLTLDYKPNSMIQLQFGADYLFASKNMEALKGGNASGTNAWAYLMLKVSPTLLYNEFTK